MKYLRWFTRAIDTVNEWVGKALSYLLLVIFLIMAAEVFFRYCFNSPSVWRNELVQLLFAVYVILSGGYVLATKGHVNVDIITGRLTPRTRAVIDVATSFLFFGFVGFLVYYGWEFAWESIEIWETSQTAWDPPIYPIKALIPVGGALLLLQGIAKLIRDIAFAVTGEDLLPSHLHAEKLH